MHRVSFAGVLLVGLVVLAVAAAPQGRENQREPLKLGDRLSQLVGESFYANGSGGAFPYLNQGERGPWKLIRVGVDFAELESEEDALLVPLSAVMVKLEK